MKNQEFNELVQSIRQAGEIQKGKLKAGRVFKFHPLVVKQIRQKLHQSQKDFAEMIGVNLATLQNWEQGRRHPEGPALTLLKVVSKNPRAVLKALHA